MNFSTIRKSLRSVTAVVLVCALPFLTGCEQSISVTATATQQTGASVSVTYRVVWDPPGSFLANLNASQALLNLSLSNATITSASGTANLMVKDLTTGQIVGQQPFGWFVSGSSVYAQNPTAVYNWLQQFTGYSNVDVIVDVTPTMTATSEGSASAVGSAVYQGTPYASTTVGWDYTRPGGCTTRICPIEE